MRSGNGLTNNPADNPREDCDQRSDCPAGAAGVGIAPSVAVGAAVGLAVGLAAGAVVTVAAAGKGVAVAAGACVGVGERLVPQALMANAHTSDLKPK